MASRISRTALTEGSALMPERLMAMTKGDAAAVPWAEARLRPGSVEGTRRPMMNVPKM